MDQASLDLIYQITKMGSIRRVFLHTQGMPKNDPLVAVAWWWQHGGLSKAKKARLRAKWLKPLSVAHGFSVSQFGKWRKAPLPDFQPCVALLACAFAKHRKESLAATKDRHRAWEAERRTTPEHKARMAKWRGANREKLNAWFRNMDNTRRANDPGYRANRAVRARLHKRLKAAHLKKHWRTCELIGCSDAELKAHLESQFVPGMTWENHGTVWHIDHRVPLASFNLVDPDQQKKACHFTNLQPLFAVENMAKSDKLVYVKS
jgi:hypothetical protein